MSRESLPCIVCGAELQNITDDSENQPNDGLAFISHGHYGSTSFDPFDGTYLEINICDACVQQAQLRGEILWGRDERPVLADSNVLTIPEVVGYEKVDRPLVPWNGTGGSDEVDVAHVARDEIGRTDGAFKRVRWNPALLGVPR